MLASTAAGVGAQSIDAIERCRTAVSVVDADEGDLAGGVVLEHAVAAELGEAGAAFVGPDGDQLVARLRARTGPRGR